MAGRIRYAYLEEEPVIFDDDQAFRLKAGRWRPLHTADAMCKAKLLTRTEFENFAPNAPTIPII